MKNIHVLPTDKPSRLYTNMQGVLSKDELKMRLKNYNIYITSDEEIKDGDWCIDDIEDVFKIEGLKYFRKFCKKIILTTDQDLIKDGVQAIDDEFLEWFVKNPSCEEVEVREIEVEDYVGFAGHTSYPTFHKEYTIIIPKEQPKQETLEEVAERIVKSKVGLHYFGNENSLENLAKKEYVMEGAKWQQERSYSEEDMREAFIAGGNSQIEEDDAYGSAYFEYMEKWFKQFKKK
jgi:hypothetical protein